MRLGLELQAASLSSPDKIICPSSPSSFEAGNKEVTEANSSWSNNCLGTLQSPTSPLLGCSWGVITSLAREPSQVGTHPGWSGVIVAITDVTGCKSDMPTDPSSLLLLRSWIRKGKIARCVNKNHVFSTQMLSFFY